jgi:hypothetical protein
MPRKLREAKSYPKKLHSRDIWCLAWVCSKMSPAFDKSGTAIVKRVKIF